jgi:hypothetical protein
VRSASRSAGSPRRATLESRPDLAAVPIDPVAVDESTTERDVAHDDVADGEDEETTESETDVTMA